MALLFDLQAEPAAGCCGEAAGLMTFWYKKTTFLLQTFIV
jgi:hypothetical protein